MMERETVSTKSRTIRRIITAGTSVALAVTSGAAHVKASEERGSDNPYTCAQLMAPPGPKGEPAGPGYKKFYNNDPSQPIYCIVDQNGEASLTHGPVPPNSTPVGLP